MATNVAWFPLGTSNKFSSAKHVLSSKVSSRRAYFCNFVGNLRPGVLASSIVLQPMDAVTKADIRLVRRNKGIYVRDREQILQDLPLRLKDHENSWTDLLSTGSDEATSCFTRTTTTFNDPNGLGSDDYRSVSALGIGAADILLRREQRSPRRKCICIVPFRH
jgi:hypothetical protein